MFTEDFIVLSPPKLVEKALQVYHEEIMPSPEPSEPSEDQDEHNIVEQLEQQNAKKGGDNSKRSSAKVTINKKVEVTVDQSASEEVHGEEQETIPTQPAKEVRRTCTYYSNMYIIVIIS